MGVFAEAKLTSFLQDLVSVYDNNGWTSQYYDDMDWAIEALVNSAKQTTNTSLSALLLNRAESLQEIVQGAHDTDCCGSSPGGYWWSQAKTYKVRFYSSSCYLLKGEK